MRRDAERGADRLSAALEAVIDRFRVMVRSVGARHQLSEADLDEVLQDVRIRLWRADPEGERIGQLTTSYVYRAAHSAAVDLLRQRRARPAEPLPDEHEEAASDAHAPGPDHALEGAELEARILAVVDTLQPARRAAVRLHLSGYDAREIVRLMGWSEGRTRNLLSRGLAELRARLVQEGITTGGGR